MSAPTDTWIQTLSQSVPSEYVPHVIYGTLGFTGLGALMVIAALQTRRFKDLQDRLARSIEQQRRNEQ